jgi:hypothetical protein
MKMRGFAGAVAMVLAFIPGEVPAQQASAEVQKACRDVAGQISRVFMDAKKRGVKDFESGIYRPSSNWAEQVAHYMAQALSRSDSLTEKELATLGATYCIERRPSMK